MERAYAHPNIRSSTLADWKHAVSYDHPEAMLGAAANPRLTPGMARDLHAQNSLRVDQRLAANPATPSDVLDACIGRRSKDVDVALARNPNLTPNQYEQLCARNQGDDDFHAALRDNPRLARYHGKGR